MRFIYSITRPVVVSLFAICAIAVFNISDVYAEEETVAFPDKYMVRLGAYFIDGSQTQFAVSTPLGLGTVLDYSRDLGGESRDTIPRMDAYYRFSPRHRIDFTTFAIDRSGTRTLTIDTTIGGQDYLVSETINSDIKYQLYRLGYGYSFYHSPKVELTVTAGLNFTSYDMSFVNDGGNKVETAGFSAPLPMFGLRMGYAITPKWSVHCVAEVFFLDFEDKVRGAMMNYELNTEYKLFKNFAIGAGLARLGSSVEVNDDNWTGQVSDSYRGYTLFGTLYF